MDDDVGAGERLLERVGVADVAAPVAHLRPAVLGRMIGREAQLERLQQLCARAHSGTFTLALVKGDAGIGKSRLVRELEPSPGTLTLRGSCFPIAGEEAPYGPLVAALRDVPGDLLSSAASRLPRSPSSPSWRSCSRRCPRPRRGPGATARAERRAVSTSTCSSCSRGWPTKRRSC